MTFEAEAKLWEKEKKLLYCIGGLTSLFLSPLAIFTRETVGEFQSGVLASFGLTAATLLFGLLLDQISSERRYRGYLRGLYFEMRLGLGYLKIFPTDPNSVISSFPLQTSSWEQFKSSDFIDPASEFHQKISRVYDGFYLVSHHMRAASEALVMSTRPEWAQIAKGMTDLTRTVLRWVNPLAEEASEECVRITGISGEEAKKVEAELAERIKELQKELKTAPADSQD